MILPPPGLHPSQDEIYAFYKHISENVALPVMIYNNPGSQRRQHPPRNAGQNR